jgi:hypothetical protein
MTEVLFESTDATELAVTFIEVTRSVTQGAETVEIFTELAEKCVRLLPVSAAGILLRDVEGTLQVIGASSPSAHLLDLFQVLVQRLTNQLVATDSQASGCSIQALDKVLRNDDCNPARNETGV